MKHRFQERNRNFPKIVTLFVLVTFILFFFFSNITHAVSSLLGSWNFNEGTGTTVSNVGTIGSAVNGTLTNMADPATADSGWTASGKVGGGIIFDGVNDIINFGSDSSVDDLFNNDTTFSLWMNPTSCSSAKYVGGKTNGSATGVYIFSSNGLCNPRIDVYHSTTRALYISAANSITANQWNLVTYVWHASTKTAQIYVNGVEVEYSAQTPGVGTYVTDATRNLTLGTWGPAGGSLFTGILDEFKIYNYARTLTDIKADAGFVTSSTSPVTVIKNTSYLTSLLFQIPGEADNNFAEFKLKNIGGNIWTIQGLKIFDLNGTHDPYILNENDSVWEYAYILGIAGDPEGFPANWNFFGNGHGNESTISYTLSVDGLDITSLPVSSVTQGNQIVVDQNRNVLLPKDGTTQVGTVRLIHTLNSNGLLVDHAHTYLSGYEIYNAYSAMLPTDHSTTTGVNRSQIGNNAIYQLQNDNSAHDTSTIAASALAFGTNQPYAVRMTLPSGGPDITGNWSYDTGVEKIWFYDTAAYGKVYVNWVSGGYGGRTTAVASQHQARYQVFKNTLAPSGPDADNDLIANFYDIDIDGDEVLNGSDTDIDGDGLLNGVDSLPSGIGSDGDIDGDGTPNGVDSDIDGDGFVNGSDGDIDGDGTTNGQDLTPSGTLDVTPSVISEGSPSGNQSSGTTEVLLSLATNEDATCKYGTSPNTLYSGLSNTFGTTGGRTHTKLVTGLSAGDYIYYIRCIDTSNNSNILDYVISFAISSVVSSSGGGGIVQPSISEVIVSNITPISALVSYKTNYSTNSTIEYGTSTLYGLNKFDDVTTTAHSILLDNLVPFTTYNFKIKSISSINVAFTTLAHPSSYVFPSTNVSNNVNFNFTKILQYGSNNNEVKELQVILKQLGFFPQKVDLSDNFGPITRQSVTNYQKSIGYYADGIVGHRIIKSLNNQKFSINKDYQFINDLKYDDTGEEVKKLQNRLKEESFFPYYAMSTGWFGPITYNSIILFQKFYGLFQSGNLDKPTRDKFNQ